MQNANFMYFFEPFLKHFSQENQWSYSKMKKCKLYYYLADAQILFPNAHWKSNDLEQFLEDT